jgi:hypothetical protein
MWTKLSARTNSSSEIHWRPLHDLQVHQADLSDGATKREPAQLEEVPEELGMETWRSLAGGFMPRPPEGFVKTGKDGRALGEARFVVRVGGAKSSDEAIDARGFWPPVFPVLEVDVVDDLGDLVQGRIVQVEALHQHLEGAAIALVGVLRLEHVEAQLAGRRLVALAGHELEARLLVDEVPDKPGAGNAVDLDALACDPGAPRGYLWPRDFLRRFNLRWFHGLLQFGDKRLGASRPLAPKKSMATTSSKRLRSRPRSVVMVVPLRNSARSRCASSVRAA